MFRILVALAVGLTFVPVVVSAQQVMFGNGWKEQRFSMFSSNDFSLNGESLGVRSDGTVSLMWTALPQSVWDSRVARWDWTVEKSVKTTDLTKKGGDDRNISVYFIFLPDSSVAAAEGKGVMALLDNPDVRVLMYVWGGADRRDTVLPTPYLGSRGRSIIKRGAGTGSASEVADLARDFRRAFGEELENLVGLAVSADSDDTGGEIEAQLSRLRLE